MELLERKAKTTRDIESQVTSLCRLASEQLARNGSASIELWYGLHEAAINEVKRLYLERGWEVTTMMSPYTTVQRVYGGEYMGEHRRFLRINAQRNL